MSKKQNIFADIVSEKDDLCPGCGEMDYSAFEEIAPKIWECPFCGYTFDDNDYDDMNIF